MFRILVLLFLVLTISTGACTTFGPKFQEGDRVHTSSPISIRPTAAEREAIWAIDAVNTLPPNGPIYRLYRYDDHGQLIWLESTEEKIWLASVTQ